MNAPRSIRKLTVIAATIMVLAVDVAAHAQADQGYYGPGMMWSDGGGWMHNGAHMMGYNMWGMGWFGMLFGLVFWVLVILGLVYIYQQLTESDEGDQ